VLTVSLQVDGFLAEVDSEVAQSGGSRRPHTGVTPPLAIVPLGSAIGWEAAQWERLSPSRAHVATAGNWVAAGFGESVPCTASWVISRRRPKALSSVRAPECQEGLRGRRAMPRPVNATSHGPKAGCLSTMLYQLLSARQRAPGSVYHSDMIPPSKSMLKSGARA